MKIVDLIKKGYLVIQQHKENFKEMIKPVEQLNQAREQLQQANKQLQPMQDKFKLICDQKNHHSDELKNNMINIWQIIKSE